MRWLLVLIFSNCIGVGFSQVDSVRFYTLEELHKVNPDTVYAISLRKQKLERLPEVLYQFKNLKYLDAGKNKLTKVPRLSEFDSLIYLNLEKNQLHNFPVAICSMSQLQEVVLNRNEFTSIPSCIEYAVSLKKLDLWSIPLADLPLELAKLKFLEEIDLSEIRFSPTMQEKFKALLPRVNLIMDAPCDCMG